MLMENWISFDIIKKDVKLVRLIRISAIVQEYIGPFLATNLPRNADGLSGRLDRHNSRLGNMYVHSK